MAPVYVRIAALEERAGRSRAPGGSAANELKRDSVYEIIGVLPARFRFLDRDPQILTTFKFARTKVFALNFRTIDPM